MKIYPEDTFEIDSTLTAGEIFSALDAVVEPPKLFRWGSSNCKKYQGELTYSNFKIWRIIGYRNSFLPIIEGQITPSNSGSLITVKMRLQRFVAAFILLWLGGVSVAVVTLSIAAMMGRIKSLPGLLIPPGMLLFGIAMTSGCFWWEAKKSKPFLVGILKGSDQ